MKKKTFTTENTEYTEKRQKDKKQNKNWSEATTSRIDLFSFVLVFLSFFRVFRVFRGECLCLSVLIRWYSVQYSGLEARGCCAPPREHGRSAVVPRKPLESCRTPNASSARSAEPFTASARRPVVAAELCRSKGRARCSSAAICTVIWRISVNSCSAPTSPATGRHFVLQEVIHGPFYYPAGGDKSHQLLDLMAALKCQFPRQVHFLLGNHELAQYTQRRISKGDLDLNQCFREGVGTAYGGRAPEVYAVYLELLGIVPLALRTPNRILLTHSLPPASRLADFDLAVLERDGSGDGDVVPGGAVHSLVWGRDTRAETAAAFLAKMDADLLITGHVPCDNGFDTPSDRQLILDSLGTPACYCLFPTDRPLTHEELVHHVNTLS
jgi:hypothetical protein